MQQYRAHGRARAFMSPARARAGTSAGAARVHVTSNSTQNYYWMLRAFFPWSLRHPRELALALLQGRGVGRAMMNPSVTRASSRWHWGSARGGDLEWDTRWVPFDDIHCIRFSQSLAGNTKLLRSYSTSTGTKPTTTPVTEPITPTYVTSTIKPWQGAQIAWISREHYSAERKCVHDNIYGSHGRSSNS